MQAMLNIAVRAARRAGDIIVRHYDRVDTLKVETKSPNEFVTEVDRQAEAAIMDIITRAYPGHAFMAEESGETGDGDFVWIIDPLDGTTNFLHGFPVFSVSIALKVKGRLEVGVVYDPMRQELFKGLRGSGATLNDRKIRVSRRNRLEGALLGTGFPYRDLEHLDRYLAIFRELMQKTAGIRRPGSAALDLASVACGRLDGFWEYGLKPWDLAAGALLIQEAGGFVGSMDGRGDPLDTGDIVAGGERVYTALRGVIADHWGSGM